MNNKNGISMVSLVVTVVVLLILAGVSVSLLDKNDGTINQAHEAKNQTESSDEKEKVEIAVVAASKKDKWGEINKENLEDELDKNIGKEQYELSVEEDNSFKVTYSNSKRSYKITEDGTVTALANE